MSDLLDFSAEWASIVMSTFADCGVTDVVQSPGSRSTPFLLAALREPRLTVHDVIDERSAAFFALGQARVTGRAALLLCTSGSAPFHYAPAVVEASYACVPLLVLSADRPLEVQQCGAAQTVDQVKLFGTNVRGFFDLGAAEPSVSFALGTKRMVAQSVMLTVGSNPGPVHLNIRARKPLEPSPVQDPVDSARSAPLHALVGAATPRVYSSARLANEEGIEVLALACRENERGLIVAGPASLASATMRDAVARLVTSTGFAFYAEATSQLRFGLPIDQTASLDALAALLHSGDGRALFSAECEPTLVIEFGATPTLAGYERWLSSKPNVRRFVLSPAAWTDATNTATDMIFGDVRNTIERTVAKLGSVPRSHTPAGFLSSLRLSNAQAWRAVGRALESEPAPLGEADVVRQVVATSAPGSLLALGNSLPVRLVDIVCPSTSQALGVLSQRGANGIDGVLSGAFGAASTGACVQVLLGDVSLLHDLSALALAAHARRAPMPIVVLNNRGGRIFDGLPIAKRASREALAHFTTPHAHSFEHAAQFFGLAYRRAETRLELRDSLQHARNHEAPVLIEACVPPDSAGQFLRRLSESLVTP